MGVAYISQLQILYNKKQATNNFLSLNKNTDNTIKNKMPPTKPVSGEHGAVSLQH